MNAPAERTRYQRLKWSHRVCEACDARIAADDEALDPRRLRQDAASMSCGRCGETVLDDDERKAR